MQNASSVMVCSLTTGLGSTCDLRPGERATTTHSAPSRRKGTTQTEHCSATGTRCTSARQVFSCRRLKTTFFTVTLTRHLHDTKAIAHKKKPTVEIHIAVHKDRYIERDETRERRTNWRKSRTPNCKKTGVARPTTKTKESVMDQSKGLNRSLLQ